MPPRSRITNRKIKKRTVTTTVRQRRSKRTPRIQRPIQQPRQRTRRARSQPSLLALGGSSRPLSRTTARNTIRAGSKRQGEYIRFSGTELIGSVVVPTGGDVANCLLYHRFNNITIPDTRIGQNAPLWNRWLPHKWRYRFIPSVPTGTQAGTYVFGQVPDPMQPLTSGASGLAQQIRVAPGSSMKQYWQPSECDLSPLRDYTSLWTFDPTSGAAEASDRLDLAGQVALVTVTPGNLTAGYPLGAIELDYDVEFYVPKLSSTTLSKKTSVRVPAALARSYGISPQGTNNASPLQAVVKLLQDAKLPDLSEAIDGVLKNYQEFKTLSPPTTSSLLTDTPTSSGFPPGKYKFTWAMYTDTQPDCSTETKTGGFAPTTSASYNYLVNAAGSADGIFARGTNFATASTYMSDNDTQQMPSLCALSGASLDYPPDPVTNTVIVQFGGATDPTGQQWEWGEGYSVEFSTLSDTHGCYADLILHEQFTPPVDAVIFCSLEVAGDDFIYAFSDSLSAKPKRIHKSAPGSKPSPSQSSSLSTPVPRLKPPFRVVTTENESKVMLDPDDDGTDYIPPRRSKLTTVDPGSSHYVPSSTPQSQKELFDKASSLLRKK